MVIPSSSQLLSTDSVKFQNFISLANQSQLYIKYSKVQCEGAKLAIARRK